MIIHILPLHLPPPSPHPQVLTCPIPTHLDPVSFLEQLKHKMPYPVLAFYYRLVHMYMIQQITLLCKHVYISVVNLYLCYLCLAVIILVSSFCGFSLLILLSFFSFHYLCTCFQYFLFAISLYV